MTDVRVLIVGGGLAGCTVAKMLEDEGRGGDVLIVDRDPQAPYDRPPLTKAFLGPKDRLVQSPPWAPADVPWLADCAVAVDLLARAVQLASGRVLRAQTLVLAAGSLARDLPGRDNRVLTLRTVSDALRVREIRSGGAGCFLVEGAGPLGMELASTLADDGASVTVVDPASAPMERLLGGALATEVASWAAEAGVRLRLDTKVVHAVPVGDRHAVEAVFSDGEAEAFDCMITAVGSVPAPMMLHGSRGAVGAAVVDDMRRLVDVDGSHFEGVFAVGDLAFHRDADRSLVRSESWTAAKNDGEAVGRQILGLPAAAEAVPYFWTRQFGRMVQVLGAIPLGAEVVPIAVVPKTGGMLYQASIDGSTVGFVGVNAQRLVAMLQMQGGAVAEWVAPEVCGGTAACRRS